MTRSDLPFVAALDSTLATSAVEAMMAAHDKAEATQHATYSASHIATYAEMLEAALAALAPAAMLTEVRAAVMLAWSQRMGVPASCTPTPIIMGVLEQLS